MLEERLGFFIETIDTSLDCLLLAAKDSVCLSDVDKTTSADNLIDATIEEGLTDNVCPVNQTSNELLILTDARQNLRLDRRSRIRLLKGDGETLKECFVQNVGANEATIVRTFALGVCRSKDLETFCRIDILTSLLKEDTLTLKD